MQNIIAKDLSAGQRRKLSITISLVRGSKVIFLDESSSGMILQEEEIYGKY